MIHKNFFGTLLFFLSISASYSQELISYTKVSSLNKSDLKIHVLGAGSNILIRDKGIQGIVIKLSSNFSGINLLEIFMDIKSTSDREVQWMIIVHLVFIFSGVLLAIMDFIASKTSKH